jgi:hypothetical protein
MTSLEKFNTDLCDATDLLSTLVDSFTSWFPRLTTICQGLSETFQSPISVSGSNSIAQYVDASKNSSVLLSQSMTALIADRFTTTQIKELRDIFVWFSNVSKCSNDFRPQFSTIFSTRADKLQKVLDRKFSKILTELAETVDTEPSAFALLNLLPISFPRQLIAYSLLFCQLLDIHQRLVSADAAEQSRRELFNIHRKFPAPKVLMGWPKFVNSLRLQNELIQLISQFRLSLRRHSQKLVAEAEKVGAVRRDIDQIVQVYLVDLKEQSLASLAELIDASVLLRDLHMIQRGRPLCARFDEIVLPADLRRDRLLDLREKLNAEVAQLRACLAKPKPIQKNNVFRTFAERMLAAYRTAPAIDFGVIDEVGKGLAAVQALTDRLFDKKTVYFQTVVAPSRMNLDAIAKALQSMIEEKKKKAVGLLKEICDRRAEVDRMAATAETLKAKVQDSDRCRNCEEHRAFVLTKCGHSFCDNCLSAILDAPTQRCPYATCSVVFTAEDIVRINWE